MSTQHTTNRLTTILRLSLIAVVFIPVLLVSASTALAQPSPVTGSDFYGINFVAPYEPWLTLTRESGVRSRTLRPIGPDL